MPSRVISKRKGDYSRLDENVISQIRFEVEQIDLLLESYSGLIDRAKTSTPDLVEVTAMASVLHSFYNGLENIFLSIAKGIDVEVPAGSQWHRNLLNRMAESTAKRSPVLTIELVRRLGDYLAFRHFYRHSYSFFLEWDEMGKLVIPLEEIWDQTRVELQRFLANLSS